MDDIYFSLYRKASTDNAILSRENDHLVKLLERVAETMADSLEPIAFEIRSAIKVYKEDQGE